MFIRIGIAVLLLSCHFFAFGSAIGPDMQRLCAKAESRVFSPAPATARLPSDSLLAAISQTDDPVAIKRALGTSDPDAPRGSTKTPPLAYAASAGNWPAAMVLIEAGADINRAAGNGDTPLERALLLAHPDIACKLIQHGAILPKPTADNAYLLPASALASGAGDAVTLVSFLLDRGYNINAVLPPGNETALIIAAEAGNTRLIELLLQRGANTGLRNTQNETALMVAKRAGHKEIMHMLSTAAKK